MSESFREQGICCAPPLRASVAQGLFYGGSGRRAAAHTRPEFPKMPTVPSAFPLLGAPQAPGDEPNLPEGSEILGGRPPEAEGTPPGAETHSARSAPRQHGRPKCYPAPGDVQSKINLSPKWFRPGPDNTRLESFRERGIWVLVNKCSYGVQVLRVLRPPNAYLGVLRVVWGSKKKKKKEAFPAFLLSLLALAHPSIGIVRPVFGLVWIPENNRLHIIDRGMGGKPNRVHFLFFYQIFSGVFSLTPSCVSIVYTSFIPPGFQVGHFHRTHVVFWWLQSAWWWMTVYILLNGSVNVAS